MSMALACHGGASITPLTTHHLTAVQTMWDQFDLVGVTEHFDEFLVLLTDLVGLQAPGIGLGLGLGLATLTLTLTLTSSGCRRRRTARSSLRQRRSRRASRPSGGLRARAPPSRATRPPSYSATSPRC